MQRLISTPRISETVAREIEQRILEGSFRAGDRLPPERDLAQQWGISRASLREAIRVLVAKGLLHSRQGEGTFVTDRLDAGFSEPWEAMLRQHPSVREDMLEFRHMLEATAAECAALRATDDDRQRLRQCHERLEAAFAGDDLEEQVDRDVAFHQAIAEAAHNVMIGHLTASLFRVTHEHIDRNLRHLRRLEDDWQELRGQHAAIWDAVKRRDPLAAQAAVRCHMSFVEESMLARAQHEERENRARVTRKLSGQGA